MDLAEWVERSFLVCSFMKCRQTRGVEYTTVGRVVKPICPACKPVAVEVFQALMKAEGEMETVEDADELIESVLLGLSARGLVNLDGFVNGKLRWSIRYQD